MRSFTVRMLARPAVVILLLVCCLFVFSGCKKKTPEDRFNEARQLLQERQIPLAMLKLRDIITQYPDSEIIPDVRLQLAEVNLMVGREENVEEALRQLTMVFDAAEPGDQRFMISHQMICELNARAGKFDKTLEQAQKGVDKAANNPEVLSQLTMFQATVRLAGTDETERQTGIDFLHDQMLNSESLLLRGQSRELLAEFNRGQEKYAESNAIYQEYIDKYPDDSVIPMLQMAMGLNYQAMGEGEKEKAEASFRAGADKMIATADAELDAQERARTLTDLALFHERFRDLEKAEALLRRVMSENKLTQTALKAQFSIGDMYIRNGLVDKAEEHFLQIKRENQGSPIEQTIDQYLQGISNIRAQIAANDAATTPGLEAATPPPPSAGEEATP